MKILIVIFFLMAGYVHAGEVQLQLLQMSRIADDDMYQVGGWEGLQLSYQFDESPVYLFGSYEEAGVYPKGKAFDYTFMGIGAGLKYPIAKHISLFGQVGYYFIENSWGGKKREFNEGLHYYLNDRWYGSTHEHIENAGYIYFDAFEVQNENAFGGTIGIELDYPISKNWSAGMLVSYRNMKVKELVRGYRDEWTAKDPGWVWEFDVARNYSSLNFGMSLDYSF